MSTGDMTLEGRWGQTYENIVHRHCINLKRRGIVRVLVHYTSYTRLLSVRM